MANTAEKITEQPSLKISIERSTLLRSLARLQSVVEKRNTIPILANIKLEASGNTLQLTATDMDLVASEIIPATVGDAGSLTVPAQTLYDIVRKLPEGSNIAIDTDARTGQVVVTSGTSRFTLSYLPSDDFPVMSEGNLSHNFTLKSREFLALLNRCRFAMSSEETRYYLNGVYMHADDVNGRLKAVATDGHRLARIETALPQGASGMPGVIIPRKAVNELGKLLEEQGEDVTISLSETKIRFAAGNIVLLSKLVDGTFPDYQRVIPEGNRLVMEADTRLLAQSVDRVATISTEKTRGIKFSMTQDSLNLAVQSTDNNSAKDDVNVTYSATPMEIGFNSRYVLEMLSQIPSGRVRFLFADANSPTVVNDPEDAAALYVLMPMRV